MYSIARLNEVMLYDCSSAVTTVNINYSSTNTVNGDNMYVHVCTRVDMYTCGQGQINKGI